jgi:hypothetical protein
MSSIAASSSSSRPRSMSFVGRVATSSRKSSASAPLSTHRPGATTTSPRRNSSNATRLRSRPTVRPVVAASVLRRWSSAWRNAAPLAYFTSPPRSEGVFGSSWSTKPRGAAPRRSRSRRASLAGLRGPGFPGAERHRHRREGPDDAADLLAERLRDGSLATRSRGSGLDRPVRLGRSTRVEIRQKLASDEGQALA